MQKSLKRRIDSILELMEEAHGAAAAALAEGKEETAMQLLRDCQNAAVSIGTGIEDSEGEGHPAVKILEDYCEQLFLIYGQLSEGNTGINPEKTAEELEKAYNLVKDSIAREIRVVKEVVFLPYKASMWDSLESVWRKADADPACSAYVVPIPYFDKNPDGSFREYHYEGCLYPDDVPVTYYGDFNLEERHPDVIYIHNPYDTCNYVTSVHPDYYSAKLKNYTDKLVYIPYFVLEEPANPDQLDELTWVSHFATMPGVLNADEVIVQSEAMKKAYVNILTSFAGEGTRPVWEKRILGLGSPKYDKVANIKRGNAELPEEWRKVLEKPGGGYKKVVFYNTSVSALLQNNDKMLEKMRDVFGVFYENRERVALLWRPHPLIRATIESMRPALWQAYEELVKKYREEGWGIYDDSAELARAIAVSDAYYGDQSSVVQLCRKAGLPVMIQNVHVSGGKMPGSLRGKCL